MITRDEKIDRARYIFYPDKKLAVKIAYIDGVEEIVPITYEEFEKEATDKISLIKAEYKKFIEDKTKTKAELLLSVPFYRDWKDSWEHLLHRIKNPIPEGADSDIQKAKLFPIGDLIQFNAGNFSNCIWHNEKTPSMKRYKDTNTVYCFSCNKSGDPIDVVMQLYGVELKEAVHLLNSKKIYEI